MTPDEELKAAARAIADALGETHPRARNHVRRIVRGKGLAFAHEHLERALLLQVEGGLPRHDGRGMRTLGGTFFALVRETVGPSLYAGMVFNSRDRAKRKRIFAHRLAAVQDSPLVQDWVRTVARTESPAP